MQIESIVKQLVSKCIPAHVKHSHYYVARDTELRLKYFLEVLAQHDLFTPAECSPNVDRNDPLPFEMHYLFIQVFGPRHKNKQKDFFEALKIQNMHIKMDCFLLFAQATQFQAKAGKSRQKQYRSPLQ